MALHIRHSIKGLCRGSYRFLYSNVRVCQRSARALISAARIRSSSRIYNRRNGSCSGRLEGFARGVVGLLSDSYNNEVILNVLLGGSWVVISGVIGPLIRIISINTLLITLLITTHEPPSKRGLVGPLTGSQTKVLSRLLGGCIGFFVTTERFRA